MKKKFVGFLMLVFLALPVLGFAQAKNENSPFDQLWNAIEAMQGRLDVQDVKNVTFENESEHQADIAVLNNRIDNLTGILNDLTKDETLSCGMGMCYRTVPKYVDGILQACAPGLPRTELCDGLDNDCDGRVDEDYPNGCCLSTLEVCDRKDNDCDGIIDEGFPEGYC